MCNSLRHPLLLQAVLGGNESPNADDIKTILDSGAYCSYTTLLLPCYASTTYHWVPLCLAVSIEADSDRVDQLLSELEGKSIEEVIASGASKLASVPSGGGGGGGAAAGGGGGAAAAGVYCVLILLMSANGIRLCRLR